MGGIFVQVLFGQLWMALLDPLFNQFLMIEFIFFRIRWLYIIHSFIESYWHKTIFRSLTFNYFLFLLIKSFFFLLLFLYQINSIALSLSLFLLSIFFALLFLKICNWSNLWPNFFSLNIFSRRLTLLFLDIWWWFFVW